MIGGVRIQADPLMPNGTAALVRRGAAVAVGKVATVMEQYRAGDLFIVSDDLWHGLQAQFARDVTPTSPREEIAQDGERS